MVGSVPLLVLSYVLRTVLRLWSVLWDNIGFVVKRVGQCWNCGVSVRQYCSLYDGVCGTAGIVMGLLECWDYGGVCRKVLELFWCI